MLEPYISHRSYCADPEIDARPWPDSACYELAFSDRFRGIEPNLEIAFFLEAPTRLYLFRRDRLDMTTQPRARARTRNFRDTIHYAISHASHVGRVREQTIQGGVGAHTAVLNPPVSAVNSKPGVEN